MVTDSNDCYPKGDNSSLKNLSFEFPGYPVLVPNMNINALFGLFCIADESERLVGYAGV